MLKAYKSEKPEVSKKAVLKNKLKPKQRKKNLQKNPMLKRKLKSARKTLSKGLEIQDIADFTGLSYAEVESLKQMDELIQIERRSRNSCGI